MAACEPFSFRAKVSPIGEHRTASAPDIPAARHNHKIFLHECPDLSARMFISVAPRDFSGLQEVSHVVKAFKLQREEISFVTTTYRLWNRRPAF